MIIGIIIFVFTASLLGWTIYNVQFENKPVQALMKKHNKQEAMVVEPPKSMSLEERLRFQAMKRKQDFLNREAERNEIKIARMDLLGKEVELSKFDLQLYGQQQENNLARISLDHQREAVFLDKERLFAEQRFLDAKHEHHLSQKLKTDASFIAREQRLENWEKSLEVERRSIQIDKEKALVDVRAAQNSLKESVLQFKEATLSFREEKMMWKVKIETDKLNLHRDKVMFEINREFTRLDFKKERTALEALQLKVNLLKYFVVQDYRAKSELLKISEEKMAIKNREELLQIQSAKENLQQDYNRLMYKFDQLSLEKRAFKLMQIKDDVLKLIERQRRWPFGLLFR